MLIATHSGSFHADDVVGIALATVLYPQAQVIRTRDVEVLKKADMRLDVGGKANPETGDFDHHFAGAPIRENGSKYSGVGLFWATQGEKVLRKIFPGLSPETAAARARIIDRMFLEGMDRIDNGQEVADRDDKIVSETLGRYNLNWIERPETFADVEGAITANFSLAVRRTRPVLVRMLGRIARATDPGEVRRHVAEARKELVAASQDRLDAEMEAIKAARAVLKKVMQETPDAVLCLDNPSLPWNDLIHELEEETGKHFTHVLKQETSSVWIATAVPVSKRSFEPRVLFPAAWAGLRDLDLVKATGIQGASFCHPGRWISGWASEAEAREAIKLAV